MRTLGFAGMVMEADTAHLLAGGVSRQLSEGWRRNAAFDGSRENDDEDAGAEKRVVIDTTSEDFTSDRFSWKQCWAFTGPGFLMSIAYVDPGNFESDLVAGAEFGYQLLWVLAWTTLLGFFVQELAVRLALATGRDLATCVREEFPHTPTRVAMWVATELAIVASDVPEVIGTAFAMKIIGNWPLWAGIVFSSTSAMLVLALNSRGVRPLEVFFGAIVTCLCLCYLVGLLTVGCYLALLSVISVISRIWRFETW